MRVGFVCSTSTQVEMFAPVMDAIASLEGSDFLWISLDQYYRWDAERALQDLGTKYVSLGKGVAGRRFLDMPLPAMYWHLLTDVRGEICSLLARQELDVLLFGNDRGLIEKLFVRLARAHDVKTLLVQDGILWSNEVRTFDFRRRFDNTASALLRDFAKEILSRVLRTLGLFYLAPSYLGQGGCDLIAVMGESSKRLLIARGVEPERIIITGQPRYDRFLRLADVSSELKDRLHLPTGRLTVSMFTSAYLSILRSDSAQRQQEELVNNLIRYIEQRHWQRIYLLLRPHPRESAGNYQVASESPCVRIVKEVGSLEIIAASDLVISVPSTIIVETCLFGKPLIVMRVGVRDSVSRLLGLSSNTFLEVDNFGELTDYLDQILSTQPIQQKFASHTCRELVFIAPEGAAHRIASLVTKLVQGTRLATYHFEP